MKNLLFLLSIVFFFSMTSCNQAGDRAEREEMQDMEETASYTLEKAWETDSVLLTPESVIYDEDNDVLYVSNVNQAPSEKDNNGFISKISKSGEIMNLRWVEGLNAPKGMAIVEDKLYVTDIDQLVVIDIPSAEIENKIDVENTKFLNDLAADENGELYFSGSESQKVFRYANGEVQTWIEEDLERPNGLFIEKDHVMLVAGGNLLKINKESREMETITTGMGSTDGIEYIGKEGYYIISDWQGEIFLVGPEGEKTSLLNTKDQKINTADIEFIPSENLLIVPTFFDNRIVAYNLVEQAGENEE